MTPAPSPEPCPEAVPREGHRPVFLIGYMGCGKTTLGRALARALGRGFVDLDLRLEQRHHQSVRQLWAARGEEEFRRLERDMLREVADFEDVVVSCGGGTPCHYDNMAVMNGRGTTVWLRASLPRLCQRLWAGRHKRPALDGLSRQELPGHVERALRQREPWYGQAGLTLDSDALEDKDQIAGTVKEALWLLRESAAQRGKA